MDTRRNRKWRIRIRVNTKIAELVYGKVWSRAWDFHAAGAKVTDKVNVGKRGQTAMNRDQKDELKEKAKIEVWTENQKDSGYGHR
jgi:hypothetical protein